MSNSYTTTETFTRTNAIHLASKVISDLKHMQLFYGKPSDESIDQYLEELIVLLLGNHLKSVTYGFRKDDKWVIALNYKANFSSISTTDDRSGGVQSGANITGASWGSFLEKNDDYNNLTSSEKSRIESLIKLKRSDGKDSEYNVSASVNKSYYSGGTSLDRKIYLQN